MAVTVILYISEDFNINGSSLSFNSGSLAGSEACLTFVPVDDLFVEDTEHFLFHPTPESHLDMFGKNSFNSFNLEIIDNDGLFPISQVEPS